MRKKNLLLIVILIFIIFLFNPFNIKAYGIRNFYINATVNSNGSVTVQEYIEMNGKYNGTNREVLFKNNNSLVFDDTLDYLPGTEINNGTGIHLKEIRSVEKNDNFDFENVIGDLFTLKKGFSLKKYGLYEIQKESNGENYKIYMKSSKNKAFYIKYNIDDLIVLHDDIAELGWNLLSDYQEESIEKLVVTINIFDNKNIFAWKHGNVNGIINVNDKNKVQFVFNGVDKATPISIRVLFDKDIIKKDYYKRSYINALDKIKRYEENITYYDLLEENRRIIERAKYGLNILENDITENNYNNALNMVNSISEYKKEDTLIKNELINKLKIYEKLLQEVYVEEAKKSLKILKEETTDSNYYNTMESVNKILNDDIREDLIKETKKYEYKMQEYLIENAMNKKTYYEYERLKEYIYELEDGKRRAELEKKLELVKNILIKKEEDIQYYNILIDIVVVCLIFILLFLKKKIKEIKSNKKFGQKYLREIPKDYTLEKLSYLLDKNIESRLIPSIFLKLVNKNVVILKKDGDKNLILEKNFSSEYNFSKIESLVLDFYFCTKNKITLKEIKKMHKKQKNYFLNTYDSIVKKVISQEKDGNIYVFDSKNNDKKIFNMKKILLIILLILLLPFLWFIEIPILLIYLIIKNEENIKYLVFVLSIGLVFYNFFACFLILSELNFVKWSVFVNIIFFILSILIINRVASLLNKNEKYTEQGYMDYGKWMAFKRYLLDFSLFEEKDISEINIWGEYLIYANLLGCSKKILNKIKIKLGSDSEGYDNYFNNVYDVLKINNVHKFSSHNSSFSSSSSNSSSSFSSSSSSSGSSSSFGGGGSVGRF